MYDIRRIPVTIANGAALSGAADLTGMALVGIIMPSVWTLAGVGLLASWDGAAYAQVRDVDKTAAAPYGTDEWELLAADVPTGESVYFPVDPALCLGANHVKVQSQTTGTPVNQGAARTVYLLVRDLGS